MSRRFHTLKAALKYLRAPGAVEGSTAVDAPEGSQLRKFQDYRAGKVVVKINRAADSLPGNEQFCSLKAFADVSSAATKYLVNYSHRAITGIGGTGLTAELLNIDITPAGTAGLEKVQGFVAAKATVSVVPDGVGTPTNSKITGDSYKKKATKTYTFPFGPGATNPSYKSVKAAIIAAASTGTANRGVSFKPEKF